MCHNTAQKILFDLCATGRHKICHRQAQNVLQHGTKRLLDLCATGRHTMCRHTMCHRKAQNVPQEGTKDFLDFLEKNNKNNKAIIRASRASLAAKNETY
jgi:hypothetical protein